MSRWTDHASRSWVWALVGVAALGGVMTGGAVKDYLFRTREQRRLEARLRETEARLREKGAELVRAESDEAFLELEARRHLGLIRPGEIEFRFVAAEGRESMRRTDPGAR